jgi:hypothetical protein
MAMRTAQRTALAAIAAVALLAAQPAAAVERGKTVDGRAYMAGGIGLDEREQLAQARHQYSLRVATAARGSGAFLADVELRITDEAGRVVFDRRLDGPLLLVDLAPGRYSVEASLRGERRSARTTIGAQDRREITFYFDVAAGVLPEDRLADR